VHSESRFEDRDRRQRSGLAPVAAQLAVPVALGVLIGGVLAYQAGSSNNAVIPVPLGAVATPTTHWVKPSAAPSGAVEPTTPSWIRPSASTPIPAAPTATASAPGR
jgi:hypothetical protein